MSKPPYATTWPATPERIEQLAEIFGSQSALAAAIDLNNRNITEWKNRLLGIPSRHLARIYYAAKERDLVLPSWFPDFEPTNGDHEAAA